jgi:trehalose synthase-fused probable maltokinase
MSEVLDLLSDWLPNQRWFAGESRPGRLELLGSYQLRASEHDSGVRMITVALVRDAAAERPQTYQVPLVVRDIDADVEPLGYIGAATEHGDRAALVDGPHDPAFARALMGLIADEGSSIGAGEGAAEAYGQPMPGAHAHRFASSRVLSGEQSNTSIICDLRDDDGELAVPLIIKVFRTLHGGDNPDVTLQTALAAAGSLRVPPTFGQVSGTWHDPDAGELQGHFAFAQEFFAGVEDAWRVALRAAEAGDDFSQLAHSLGEATAEVHATLARVMPQVAPDQDDVDEAVEQMRARFGVAVRELPELESLVDAVDDVYERARRATWPSLQRIHGDYHLGQVLAVPDRGWVLLDFEGEPLRSLAERNSPDVPQRDLAGMLRSLEYVSGALSVRAGREVARAWADSARASFLQGYTDGLAALGAQSGAEIGAEDIESVLVAYELDKAIYEVIYEARHRPDWLTIPALAVRRLTERHARH